MEAPQIAQLIMMFLSFALEEGLPAAQKVFERWLKEDPTAEDFRLLGKMMKRPEDYRTAPSE